MKRPVTWTRRPTTIALLLVLAMAVPALAGGHLLIIGGGGRPAPVMETFVHLAGGEDAHIVVVPYASGDPADVAAYQTNQILEHGAGQVVSAPADSTLIHTDEAVALFDDATGVFLSGGDQRRLTRLLLGTEMLARIHAIHENGGVIAGTSAGAAVMSELMITGDEALSDDDRPFATIQGGNVITSQGFGFLADVIIDQHFVRRSRHNRLISLVLTHPHLLGIGIDEATAIHVVDDAFTVIGDGPVIVYDASSASVHERDGDRFLAATGLTTHILLDGDRFALATRTPMMTAE